ncbi:hypothetical protein BKN37_07610 [Mycobacterium talmoniae]|uniref:AB hydrolase-1 domain-containing protein n=1 Tax=Mycobacterium talmoniae TaxID=1858794 RepID=A0A1S1NGV2_9MYCO|nr:hypothetical protein BKN37_07610 [Mycobacterium talmoniae]TDH53153.1 alpha/beta hydrolase [Mycobacterium eburneum]
MFADPVIASDDITVTTDDGASLHVRCSGSPEAPHIVLIHGFAARIEYWNPQINALAEKYRIIAYDQRLSGRSVPGRRATRPEVLGDDLAAVLAATIPTGRTAVIVGHSFGGITVMAWAMRHPEQVRRYARAVLLANTVAERCESYIAVLPFPGRFLVVRRLLCGAVVLLPPLAVYRRLFQAAVLSRAASREAVAFTEAVVKACPARARLDWWRALVRLDVTAGLANLSVPTTVLTADRDRLTPPPASEPIVAALCARGALDRQVMLSGVGHCSNIEDPRRFNAEIARLVQLSNDRTKAS